MEKSPLSVQRIITSFANKLDIGKAGKPILFGKRAKRLVFKDLEGKGHRIAFTEIVEDKDVPLIEREGKVKLRIKTDGGSEKLVLVKVSELSKRLLIPKKLIKQHSEAGDLETFIQGQVGLVGEKKKVYREALKKYNTRFYFFTKKLKGKNLKGKTDLTKKTLMKIVMYGLSLNPAIGPDQENYEILPEQGMGKKLKNYHIFRKGTDLFVWEKTAIDTLGQGGFGTVELHFNVLEGAGDGKKTDRWNGTTVTQEVRALKTVHDNGIVPGVQEPPKVIRAVSQKGGEGFFYGRHYSEKSVNFLDWSRLRKHLSAEGMINGMRETLFGLKKIHEKVGMHNDLHARNLFCHQNENGTFSFYISDLGNIKILPEDNRKNIDKWADMQGLVAIFKEIIDDFILNIGKDSVPGEFNDFIERMNVSEFNELEEDPVGAAFDELQGIWNRLPRTKEKEKYPEIIVIPQSS
jgi:hypothetical protein